MNCQVCGGTASLAFRKRKYNILKCKCCKHYFTDLVITSEKVYDIYSDSYFNGGGDGYPDYILEKEILIPHGEYYAHKIGKFIDSGTVLDVGAAAGFILKGFENMGWKGVGIEPNLKMVEYGKKNLEIDIRQGTIENVDSDIKYNLVLMIQVIAHLYDINRSVQTISDILKPNGLVLIETWNRSSLTAGILGKYWHEYSPPSTLNFFSKRTLDILMNKFGFNKISSGRPQKKIISNHAKSLLKHKMLDSSLLKYLSGMVGIIPDNVLLTYPAEDLFWTLYRKNE